jgi:protein-tyrosine phosphatase
MDQQFIYSKSIRSVIDLTNGAHIKTLVKPISIYKINVEDNVSTNIRPYFKQSYNFINDAINKGQNVLVFCRAGMSRSASIAIYYLMKRYNISYYDAYRFLKSKRKHTKPNAGFVEQLLEQEETILHEQIV